MRPRSLLLSAITCLIFTGCTASSGLDGVEGPRPSLEMTGSVVAADRPSLPVTTAVESEGEVLDTPAEQEYVATPNKPQLFAEVPKPLVRKAVVDRRIHARQFRDAKPINFGTHSPRRLPVHGVDVSRWQGNINWMKLRTQGANFAYIKATDGGDHLDPMFKRNWHAAGEAGMRRGAYHFFYWCRTAGEQADWFIRNVPKVDNALPPVIDVEWNGESRCRKRPSRERVLEKMQVFMDKLEQHYGQRPVIYTAPDFYEDNLQGAFPNHHFWLRAVAQHPRKVYPGRKWVFWQYSGSGLSKGVEGRIDLNVFNGSEDDWHDWLDKHAG
jgi:lysozyme